MSVDRLEIHLVGNAFRCLDSGNVWIDKNRRNTLVAQCFQSLRARVVELAGLSDFQGTRTQYEYLGEFLFHIKYVV